MSSAVAVLRPWPWSRHRGAALGFTLAAFGLADRLAFAVTGTGALLMLAGFAILTVTVVSPSWLGNRTRTEELNLAFVGIFVLMTLFNVVSPYRESAAGELLLLGAAVAFLVLEGTPRLRPYRLWVVAPLLLAANASAIAAMPFPKQDVFRFLTYGVDGLFRHGLNPYRPIVDPVSSDVLPYTFTYPPGVLVLVAPFRLLLGDVRWAYIAAQAVFVAAVAAMARRPGGLATWRQAAILLPLVLPRVNGAFMDYGNHEWILLALAAAAVSLRRQWLLAGILLGLGVASKQYFVLFPVAYLLPWLEARLLAAAAVTAAGVILPFLAWDPARLLHDTTNQLAAPPDVERLTFYAMIRRLGVDVGRAGAAALAVGGLAAALAAAWLGRRSLDRALVACGVGLGIFTMCADFAAYNYYAYALAFVAWGLAVSDPEEGEERGGVPRVAGIAGEAGG